MNFMTGNDGKPTIVLPESYGGNWHPAQLTFERKPYRCPVCSGKGLVPNGFLQLHWKYYNIYIYCTRTM